MADNSIFYFAYGSNMLTERLIDRCPSAVPLGAADANGFELSFAKKGVDGSGKATLIKSTDNKAIVHGVLYKLKPNDLAALDKIEHNYTRDDNFEVDFGQKAINVTTYIAAAKFCELGLLPFDWYRDLCVAGAKQNGVDQQYISRLESLLTLNDPENIEIKYLKNHKEN